MIRLAFAAPLILAALPAMAQQPPPCGPIPGVLGLLAGEHGESPAGSGIDSRGFVVMVTVNRETDAFSLLVLRPDGIACMMGEGHDWTDYQAPAPGEPS